MLKKTMTTVDFGGTERTEDYYFNLTRAEIMEMELNTEGGFVQMINRITAAQSQLELAKLFKQILCKSYGVLSRTAASSSRTRLFWLISWPPRHTATCTTSWHPMQRRPPHSSSDPARGYEGRGQEADKQNPQPGLMVLEGPKKGTDEQ